ncbi:hypothetical protein HG530_014890 [Fusarium avenaceum]|nr:hypothetical protein HG530_014890 [Fusarium avenaceum]
MELEPVADQSGNVVLGINGITNLSSPCAPHLLLCPDLAKESLVAVEVGGHNGLASHVKLLSTTEVSSHVADGSNERTAVDVPDPEVHIAAIGIIVCLRSVHIFAKRALWKFTAVQVGASLELRPAPLLSGYNDGLLHGHFGFACPLFLESLVGLGVGLMVVFLQVVTAFRALFRAPVKVVEDTADLGKMRTTLAPVDNDGCGIAKRNGCHHDFAQVGAGRVRGEKNYEPAVEDVLC